MDDSQLRVVLLLVDLIGPITLGYILKVKNLVRPAFTDFMIKFNVRGLFTVLAFVSFWKLKFTSEVALIPLLGLLILFLPYFIGMAITRRVADPLERGALVVSSMLGNTSTLGGLICFLILGATSYAYVQVIGVLQSLVLILFCFPMCQKFRDMAQTNRGLTHKRSIKELLFTWNQVSILGMLAGAALSLKGVPQPAFFDPIFAALVHVSAWIQLLPVGLMLNITAARRAMNKNVLMILPVKFIVLPAIIWGLSRLLFSDHTITSTLVIQAACPVAINTVFCCAIYGLKTDIAMAAFALSTLVFMVTLCPLFFALL
ncbi:AEC family transporter [Mesosutterella sp. AGMB02718]|uniref:AEC family transporter n=1 Tax=Mesosutterella faecium TaxID=2925194 RepID=A0ABT7IPL3_9BURK|nr:AEC family transporter [Mesosutterella sp. AGMB02718]MDL2059821.1 AEC family transporter [Mesosutterella sp. AGMB02718]